MYGIYNMNFILSLSGQEIPCRSIEGIQEELEPEFFKEGGRNGYVHIRPGRVSKAPFLQIERYVEPGYTDCFAVGERLEEHLILEVGRGKSSREASFVRFKFKGCMVTQKSYGQLSAEKSGILLETVTVHYQEMDTEVQHESDRSI